MKNRFSVVGITSLIGLAISFLAGLSLFYKEKTASPVEAATYSQTVSQYYSGISWDKTGSDLKEDLYSLTNITSAGWSYDGLWDCYETSDTRADGTLWDIYSDQTSYTRNSPHSSTSSANAEGDYVNREHMIPQSTFNKAAPMVSDPHHVLPSDGKVNNMRSNYPHGNVSSAEYTSNDGCKLGTGTNNTKVFEPKDCYKGDIARIYFYFVTCYQNKMSSSTYSVFQSSFPHIKTVYLNVYLQWAKDDPVSQKEIDRNNAIYKGQGNRNPFIDCPYAVGAVFDSSHASDYGTKGQYTTGGSVSISKSSASLISGGTTTISATSSNSSTISWTTSNSSVVSLSSLSSSSGNNITLTAGSAGTATITAKATIDGTLYSQSCTVTVSASKQLSSISVSNPKVSYSLDDSFVKPTVTANFNDSTQETVTNSATFSGYDLSSVGNQTVTVSYTYSGTTKTTTYQISVTSSGGSGGGQTQGDSETLIMSEQGFTSGQAAAEATGTNCTVTFAQNNGSNGPKYYDTGSAVRVYPSNTITVSSESTIVEITFEFASGEGSNAITSSPSGFNSPTWSGSANSVVFTIGGSNGHRRIASITVTYESSGSSSDPITSISATPKKTFYVGETITSSDITVKDSNNNNVLGFDFTSYEFGYDDAASGGALTNKTFLQSVSYETFTCDLTVQVQRKAYSAPTGTYTVEHTGSEFSSAGIGASYQINQTATVDGITFSVDGYIFNSKLSLSQSKNNASGKVINTTPYSTGITNVSVSGATPDVQLSVDGSNWVSLASANTSTTNYYYLKLYYSTTYQSNYVNITSFTVTLKEHESPENVANYIMYEDNSGQCTSKFNVAKGYFESLTSDGRATFMTSDEYVIETARERFEAWATYLGMRITESDGDYVITNAKPLTLFAVIPQNKTVIIVIVVSLVGLTSIGGYFFIKRRKEN